MPVSQCPSCRNLVPGTAGTCPYCGGELKVTEAEASSEATATAVMPAVLKFGRTPEETGAYPYFPVDPSKFVVLSVCTLSFYTLYWSYKNWQRIARSSGETLSPFWRTAFGGLWNFSLFGDVRDRCAERDVHVGWSPVLLACITLLLGIALRLRDEVSWLNWFLFLPYLPVVMATKRLNATYAGVVSEPVNDRFSAWNVAGIVIGGIFFMLSIVGALFPQHRH